MTVKNLIIIGAGQFGHEILSWGEETFNEKLVFKGFLDDDSDDPKCLSKIFDYTIEENDVFVCSIGDPQARISICRKLIEKGAEFINWVHPSAFISKNASIGEGCVVSPFVYVANNAKIADFVIINSSSSVGHDTSIGRGSILNSHVDITGEVALGEGVTVGSGASVLPRKKVGDYATVGSMSLVVKNVPAQKTVFGVPAKAIN